MTHPAVPGRGPDPGLTWARLVGETSGSGGGNVGGGGGVWGEHLSLVSVLQIEFSLINQ